MKALETGRIILRKFLRDDFAAVHSYEGVVENVAHMTWGPNTEEETRKFIDHTIASAEEDPCVSYHYAAVLKETGQLIGACSLILSGGEAEVGGILHRDRWRHGYGAEMGEAMLALGFEQLGLHRITAHCDAENTASYRLMEKLGMRREGMFVEGRPANKLSGKKYGDELSYAVLREEWETRKEIAYYNALPVEFTGFVDVPLLSDGEIYLVCTEKKPAIPEKKYVPGYAFIICKEGEKVGQIDLRIGYADGLYYGGQIGYGIDEKHRGKGYAGRACQLVARVAKAHGMKALLITNSHTNHASKRVCEKLGARFIRVARIPEWTELYQTGQRFENIFEWNIEEI